MTRDELKPIERRVLEYLDQHGPTHRAQIVRDLSGPETRWGGSGPMSGRGSNGAAPLIMGRWCARLIKAGLVRQNNPPSNFYFYSHHEITDAGRRLLRA
jgi:hypothetical protein